MKTPLLTSLFFSLAGCAYSSPAMKAPPRGPEADGESRPPLQVRARSTLDIGVDRDGTDPAISRSAVEVEGPHLALREGTVLTPDLRLRHTRYRWPGRARPFGAAGADPDCFDPAVGLRVLQFLSPSAAVFGYGRALLSFEEDSGTSQAWAWMASAGARTELRDGLAIGGQVVVRGRLEDEPLLFPALLLDWEVAEGLRLITDAEHAELRIRLGERWHLTPFVRAELAEFRLNPAGPFGRGSLEDSAVSGGVTLEWQPAPDAAIRLQVGSSFWRELELRRDSRRLGKEELDPSLQIGLQVELRL